MIYKNIIKIIFLMVCHTTISAMQHPPQHASSLSEDLRASFETVHILAVFAALPTSHTVRERNTQQICKIMGELNVKLIGVENRTEIVRNTLTGIGTTPGALRRDIERAGVVSEVIPDWLKRQDENNHRGPTDLHMEAIESVSQVIVFAQLLENPSNDLLQIIYGSAGSAIELAKEYLPQALEKIDHIAPEILTVACAHNSVTPEKFAQIVAQARENLKK